MTVKDTFFKKKKYLYRERKIKKNIHVLYKSEI